MSKKKMDVVYASDIDASRFQLMRWAEHGLIPLPKIVRGPSGRGMRGSYPRSVIGTVKRIKALLSRGVSLSEIGKELHSADNHLQKRQEAAAKQTARLLSKWRQPLVVQLAGSAGIHKGTTIELFSLLIEAILSNGCGLRSEISKSIAKKAADEPSIAAALKLTFVGSEAVLVLDPSANSVVVAPDFVLSFVHSGALMHLADLWGGEAGHAPMERNPALVPAVVTLKFPVLLEMLKTMAPCVEMPTQGDVLWMPSLSVTEFDRTRLLMADYSVGVSTKNGAPIFSYSSRSATVKGIDRDEVAKRFAALRNHRQAGKTKNQTGNGGS